MRRRWWRTVTPTLQPSWSARCMTRTSAPTCKAPSKLDRPWYTLVFAAPSWEELSRGLQPAITFDDDDPTSPKHVAVRRDTTNPRAVVIPRGPCSVHRADPWQVSRSHAAQLPDTPHLTRRCSASFSCVACCFLSLSSHACRCGRSLGVSGHHRAARAVAGVLGSRGFAVSRLQFVCIVKQREVTTTTLIQDMDIALPDGAQLAVDTTLVIAPRWGPSSSVR